MSNSLYELDKHVASNVLDVSMMEFDAYFSTAIRTRRVSLGLSLIQASQYIYMEEFTLTLAEQRPTMVPLKDLVRLMEGYGALENEMRELCFVIFGHNL